MTVVGVVLIFLAALVVLGAVLGGSDRQVELSLGGVDVSMSATGVFVLGLAVALTFASGLELLRLGLGRSLSRRRELRHARAVVAEHERREQPQTPDTAATGSGDAGTGETTTGQASTGQTSTGGQDTAAGGGDGAHRAARHDTTLPGKPVGTDPDAGGSDR